MLAAFKGGLWLITQRLFLLPVLYAVLYAHIIEAFLKIILITLITPKNNNELYTERYAPRLVAAKLSDVCGLSVQCMYNKFRVMCVICVF